DRTRHVMLEVWDGSEWIVINPSSGIGSGYNGLVDSIQRPNSLMSRLSQAGGGAALPLLATSVAAYNYLDVRTISKIFVNQGSRDSTWLGSLQTPAYIVKGSGNQASR